ncbi:MAG: lysophospholipid acyltransferase family protein, partial [Planctomycetota bacterium]
GAHGLAVRCGARVQRGWARALLPLLGVRVEEAGPRPAVRALVVANHLSYLDILVLASRVSCRFVAKSEIAGWRIVGPLARTVGTLFLHQARRRDLTRVGAEMEATLAAGVAAAIFPEGGASRGLRVEEFHSSLFAPAADRALPCWTAGLSYRTPGAPYGEAWTVCWWGGMDLWRHLWRLLALPGIRARVRWCEVPAGGGDRKALARAARAVLAAGFTPIPQTPVPPDCPWPELVREIAAEERGPAPAGPEAAP